MTVRTGPLLLLPSGQVKKRARVTAHTCSLWVIVEVHACGWWWWWCGQRCVSVRLAAFSSDVGRMLVPSLRTAYGASGMSGSPPHVQASRA